MAIDSVHSDDVILIGYNYLSFFGAKSEHVVDGKLEVSVDLMKSGISLSILRC